MRTCSSGPKAAATGLEVRFRTSTLACLRADSLVHRAATSASCLRWLTFLGTDAQTAGEEAEWPPGYPLRLMFAFVEKNKIGFEPVTI